MNRTTRTLVAVSVASFIVGVVAHASFARSRHSTPFDEAMAAESDLRFAFLTELDLLRPTFALIVLRAGKVDCAIHWLELGVTQEIERWQPYYDSASPEAQEVAKNQLDYAQGYFEKHPFVEKPENLDCEGL